MPVKPFPLPPSGSYATPSELAQGDCSDTGAEPVGVGIAVTLGVGLGVEP
jgi:hypothetical protein